MRLGRRFLETAKTFRPDLVFVNYGELLPVGAIMKTKRETGAFTVIWLADFPGDLIYKKRVLQVVSSYDLVAVQGRDMGEVLRRELGLEAHWLPVAADPSVYYPMDLSEKEEVCFVGSWYPRREELVREISDFPLVIYGPGWDRAGPLGGGSVHTGGRKPDETRLIYSTSAINLSIHLMEPWDSVKFTQVSPRVFEVLACGAFLLSDRTSDLKELFTEGEHYVGFDSKEELREHIAFYLANNSERERIQSKGRDHVLSHHTYNHRIDSLMEIIEERI